MREIPRRVTLQANGTYIWSAELDMETERRGYRTGGLIWIWIAAVLFLLGIFLSLRSHAWQPLGYVTVLVISILLITWGVVRGQENMGQRRRTYRLMDELIATGSGRKTAVFEFKKAREMNVGKGWIELTAKIGAFRAYVPEEDFDFVRGYIQSRVPKECRIEHESD